MVRREIISETEFWRTPRRRASREDLDVMPTSTWPELRIVRPAVFDHNFLTDQWNAFQSDLGHRNRGRGKALALGSVAVSYVTAKEMGQMLQPLNPQIYRNQARTKKFLRSFAEGIRTFVRGSIEQGYDAVTSDMESSYLRVQQATRGFSMSNELEGDMYEDAEPFVPTAPAPASSPYFGEAPFAVGEQLQIFGKDGMAADLTQNDQLCDERFSLLRYLRSEGLDTSRVNSGWKPHATIFTFEQHINGAELQHARTVPASLVLDQPQPHIS